LLGIQCPIVSSLISIDPADLPPILGQDEPIVVVGIETETIVVIIIIGIRSHSVGGGC